jgi:hypothetical protein
MIQLYKARLSTLVQYSYLRMTHGKVNLSICARGQSGVPPAAQSGLSMLSHFFGLVIITNGRFLSGDLTPVCDHCEVTLNVLNILQECPRHITKVANHLILTLN